jgi:predicted CoA-binding protein
MENKPTLVVGASPNPERYAHMAVLRLREKDHPVFAVGQRAGSIGDVPIHTAWPKREGIHTVTLYLGEARHAEVADKILGLRPQRIIFNPGAEGQELAQRAKEAGMEVLEACTLVLLATGQY